MHRQIEGGCADAMSIHMYQALANERDDEPRYTVNTVPPPASAIEDGENAKLGAHHHF